MGPGDPFRNAKVAPEASSTDPQLTLSEASRVIRSPRGMILTGAFVSGAILAACVIAFGFTAALFVVGTGLLAMGIVWLAEAVLTGRFHVRAAISVLVNGTTPSSLNNSRRSQ